MPFPLLDLILVAPAHFTIPSPLIVWRVPWRVFLYSFIHRTLAEHIVLPPPPAQAQQFFVPA